MNKCPKCNADESPHGDFTCDTYSHDSGLSHLGVAKELRQSEACRIRELEAGNAKLQQQLTERDQRIAELEKQIAEWKSAWKDKRDALELIKENQGKQCKAHEADKAAALAAAKAEWERQSLYRFVELRDATIDAMNRLKEDCVANQLFPEAATFRDAAEVLKAKMSKQTILAAMKGSET